MVDIGTVAAVLLESIVIVFFIASLALLYLLCSIPTYFISWVYIIGFGLVLLWFFTGEKTPSLEQSGKRKEILVVIIGSGFSGICAAIRLKKERVPFVLIEKSETLGGTWWDNKYPGSGCDIQSLFYCFSFKPNCFSSSSYLSQSEILAYLRDTVDYYGIREHMRFGSKVDKCEFNDVSKTWSVQTSTGDRFECNYIISGIGALHVPKLPEIPGMDDFRGKQIHTAQWDTAFDWAGKRVGVIGTGCSAIQTVPKLVAAASDGSAGGCCKQLHVFQRTPTWILPLLDIPHPSVFQTCLQRFPILMILCRAYIFFRQELIFKLIFTKGSSVNRFFQQVFAGIIRKQVNDPLLKEHLVPDYQIGCRRIAISNSYFKSFNCVNNEGKKKVNLVTGEIVKMMRTSIVVKNTKIASSATSTTSTTTCHEIELDAIVYATGFDVLHSLKNVDIRRPSDGLSLGDIWTDTPNAYLGIMVPRFPNFFMLMGPSTVLGM